MSFHKLAIVTTAVLVVCGGQALGQAGPDFGPPPSGPPVPVVPGGQPGGDSLPPLRPAEIPAQPVAPDGPPFMPPAPPIQPPSGPFGSGFQHPVPPPLLPPPPLGDWLGGPPPGWFFGLEADIVQPTAKDISPGSAGERVTMDWTVAPRLTLGYCFDYGGSLMLSYRYLESSMGFDDSAVGGAVGDVTMQQNWIDFTYLTRSFGPWHHFRVQGEAGVRLAFLDVRGHSDFGTEIDDASEDFSGAGPYLGLRVSYAFGESGWSLFGRGSAAVLFGETTQRFSQFIDDGVNPPSFGQNSQSQGQTIWDFRGEAGVSWTLPRRPWFRLDVGVQLETFTWDSVAYTDIGPFLRCWLEF
jgi:hypothetical protein